MPSHAPATPSLGAAALRPTAPAMQPPRISVVGLGKIGLPLAASFAQRGFEVVAFDANPRIGEALAAGRTPNHEPGLAEALAQGKAHFTLAADVATAVKATDVTFVVVATPTDATGAYDPAQLVAACQSVGQGVAGKTTRHTVVVASTVMPGTVGGVVQSALEAAAGRRLGDQLGLAYVPEFYALGDALRGIAEPDFVLVGADQPWAADVVEHIYAVVCRNQPPVARTRLVEAELCKMGVNAFLTLKMGYANTLAALCERLPGANVDVVSHVLGLDKRIGRRFLTGALGYGGPCFPRDTRAFAALGRRLGVPAGAVEATERENDQQTARLASLVRRHVGPGGRVAVLGLAYKPDTDLIDESPGVALAAALSREGMAVSAWDPLVSSSAMAMTRTRTAVPPDVQLPSLLTEALRDADVAVVTTPDKVWATLDPTAWGGAGARAPLFVDCWRKLDAARLGAGVRIVPVGVGLPTEARS